MLSFQETTLSKSVPENPAIRRRDAEATKQRILESALGHFGRFGYKGASLRQIVSEAQANVAAANYYFGSKAGLLVATIDHYIVSTHPRRMALLDETRKIAAGKKRLRALISAYLRPHYEITIRDGNTDYATMVSRVITEENPTLQKEIDRALLPVRQRFRDELRQCFPRVGEDAIAQAVGYVVAVLAMGPYAIDPDSLAFRGHRTEDFEQVLEDSTNFTYGGLVELLNL